MKSFPTARADNLELASIHDQRPLNTKSLSIALLVESSSAGVGRHVIDLAHALTRLGHRIDLLYSSRRIDQRFSEGLVSLAAEGVKTFEIDMRHNLHPADAISIRHVRSYLRANGPFDVLHCHSTKAGFIGRLAGLHLGARVVYTPHAMITMSPFSSRAYRMAAGLLERSLALLGDAVICVSQEELEHALDLGVRPTALHLIPNGIDVVSARINRVHRNEMRSRFGVGERVICVGFVGRMSPQKAPRTLLDAFAIVERELDLKTKLVFVGSGPEIPALEKRIVELGLQGHVVLAGEQDGLRAMSAFDIFVLPSIYEGLPYVLLEALSLGLPVVSTEVGGATALIRDGVNGFLIKRPLEEDIAAALQRLIKDKELRIRVGMAATESANGLCLDAMAQRTEKLYYDLHPGTQ